MSEILPKKRRKGGTHSCLSQSQEAKPNLPTKASGRGLLHLGGGAILRTARGVQEAGNHVRPAGKKNANVCGHRGGSMVLFFEFCFGGGLLLFPEYFFLGGGLLQRDTEGTPSILGGAFVFKTGTCMLNLRRSCLGLSLVGNLGTCWCRNRCAFVTWFGCRGCFAFGVSYEPPPPPEGEL